MRVLITGASGGLGPAVVEEFIGSGADVYGVARSWPQPDDRFQQISADLGSDEGCRKAAEQAGSPEVLVHVMGGFAPGGTESGSDVWERMISVNLLSAVRMFRAVLPGMRSAGRGRLIAVGSQVASEPVAGLSAYGASKAALVHFIRTVALEVQGSGVTANIVMPGTIDTEANRRAMPGADRAGWVKPEAIARIINWLASEDAADVNGAVMPINRRS